MSTHTYSSQPYMGPGTKTGATQYALQDEANTVYQVFSDKTDCDKAVLIAQANDNAGRGLPLVAPVPRTDAYQKQSQRF